MSQPGSFHPRLSVSAISTFRLSMTEDVAFWATHGIERAGVSVAKLERDGWERGIELLADSPVRAANLIGLGPFALDHPSEWDVRRERLTKAVDAASRLGARTIVFTTGPAGDLTWEDAADALARALEPTIAAARAADVELALEHTNSLRPDVSFVHTLRDGIDLARRLGVRVCCELNACWGERALEETIRDGIDSIGVVQVSDFSVGTTTTPDRLVPGDGDIPLRRILGWILDAGYQQDFDIEIIGPRIEEEGYDSAVPRAVSYTSDLLTSLGA